MRIVILDLPLPYEPVDMDLDLPLDRQFCGSFLEVVRKFLAEQESKKSPANGEF